LFTAFQFIVRKQQWNDGHSIGGLILCFLSWIIGKSVLSWSVLWDRKMNKKIWCFEYKETRITLRRRVPEKKMRQTSWLLSFHTRVNLRHAFLIPHLFLLVKSSLLCLRYIWFLSHLLCLVWWKKILQRKSDSDSRGIVKSCTKTKEFRFPGLHSNFRIQGVPSRFSRKHTSRCSVCISFFMAS
jgi:hypothetical protein